MNFIAISGRLKQKHGSKYFSDQCFLLLIYSVNLMFNLEKNKIEFAIKYTTIKSSYFLL